MATFIAPNLQKRLPSYERRQFIAQLNSLTGLAWHNALITQKVHRVVIDVAKKTMQVQVKNDAQDAKKEDFVLLKRPYIRSKGTFADNLEMRNFYIEGDDQIAKHRGSGSKLSHEVWFYIMPDGLAQSVIINITDSKDRDSAHKPHEMSLVLNPFTAQFKEYDSFQKP